MAVRNLTQLTTTAQKGLKEFLQAEDGGTGKRTALSMGLLVGGAVMMQHLAAQPAETAHGCLYAQHCPGTDECFNAFQQSPQCAPPPRNEDCYRWVEACPPDPCELIPVLNNFVTRFGQETMSIRLPLLAGR